MMTTCSASGCAEIVEQMVLPSDQFGELVHHFLNNRKRLDIELVDRLATLEVDVRILRRPRRSGDRGRGRACGFRSPCCHDHGAHIVKRQLFDLLHFMRGPEAVKEMDKRYP